jgi:hypothetical protein
MKSPFYQQLTTDWPSLVEKVMGIQNFILTIEGEREEMILSNSLLSDSFVKLVW